MTRKPYSLTLGLPAALVFGLGAAIGNQAADKIDLSDTVAFVDMERLRTDFPLHVERETARKALHAEYDRELGKLEQIIKVKKMEAEQGYQKGTLEHDDAIVAHARAKREYELQGEKFATQLQRRLAQDIAEISRKLHAGVGEFAKKKGYQLVLRHRDTANAGLRSQVETEFVQDVLYNDQGLDITQQVIDFLKTK